jgi:hydroxyacylglutathione hydrolase
MSTHNNEIKGLPEGVSLLRYSYPAIAHTSYLLVDSESGTAAVVDPYREVDQYLEDAFRLGAKIKHVFLTKLHDDFQTGHIQLRDRTLATVYVGAWAPANSPFMLLKEGDMFEFGRVRLRILETPGHRLESLVILLFDARGSDPDPIAALTGETILCGDIGRPEPQDEDGYDARDLALMLHASFREKFDPLPQSVRLFPSHTARMDLFGTAPETMRAQRLANPGLKRMPCDEFVRRVTLGMAVRKSLPIKEVRLRSSSVDEMIRAQREGAQVVDDRDPVDYSAACLAGSINLPAASSFESFAFRLLDRARPIVLVSVPGREQATAGRLIEAGFPHVAAYLEGGMQALEERPKLLRQHRRLCYATLGSRILTGGPTLILDTRGERREVEGPRVAVYPLALEELRDELPSLPRHPEIVVIDETPYRSSAAASFLRAQGFASVSEVAGGLALWGSPS